jgi:hypothetical protein
MRACACLWALLALLGAACGEPTVQIPAPLEVAYMPLDGAIGLATDITPQVVFSGQVDAATVSAQSVLLASAPLDGSGSCADAIYESLESDAGLAGDNPNLLEVTPGTAQPGAVLAPATCYRLTLTTALKGVELGPLVDLGISDRPGVGAEAYFQTAP